MTINKETELMNSIVVYFHRCEEEGDYNALYEMGFGPCEVRALGSLSTTDKLRLTSTKSHFLTITLNRKTYWRMIDYILREKESEAMIDELIRFDAPVNMIRSLNGMGSKQFKLRRRQLGLTSLSPGRPPHPSLEEEKLVWKAVETSLKQSPSFSAKEFLDIFNALEQKVSMRIIWNLVQEWESDDILKRIRNQ